MMNCPDCGNAVPEDLAYCPVCGAPLHGGPTSFSALYSRRVPGTSVSSARRANASISNARRANASVFSTRRADGRSAGFSGAAARNAAPGCVDIRSRNAVRAAAIIVACALAIGAICGCLYFKNVQDAKASEKTAAEVAAERYPVVFTVVAPGYNDATCSKIPLHAVGTDLQGGIINENAWIDSNGKGLSLPQGEYTVTVLASPLLANGTIYDTPNDKWTITVGSDAKSGTKFMVPEEQPIVFSLTSQDAVTYEQIGLAYQYALDSGMDRDTAQAYKQKLDDSHQSAIGHRMAGEAAAQEAQQEAAENAAAYQQTGCHYACEYFEIDFPQAWAGNWSVVEVATACDWGGFTHSFNVFDNSTGERLEEIAVNPDFCDEGVNCRYAGVSSVDAGSAVWIIARSSSTSDADLRYMASTIVVY